jgi:hypothetical protein
MWRRPLRRRWGRGDGGSGGGFGSHPEVEEAAEAILNVGRNSPSWRCIGGFCVTLFGEGRNFLMDRFAMTHLCNMGTQIPYVPWQFNHASL